MISQEVRGKVRLSALAAQLLLAGACGLLLGAFVAWFSPLWTFAVVLVVVLVFATLKRPEIGLLGILATTSTIIFEGTLPLVPIGIGSLHIPDIILLSLFGIIIARRLVERDFQLIRTPLDIPLFAFYFICIVTTLLAVFRGFVDATSALRAIRIVTYYLSFFAVTNLIREQHQLRFLIRGSLLLAVAVAAAMVAQSWLGESNVILPGRVETLATQGARYGGVFRILPPGQSLVLVMFMVSGVLLVLNDPKPVRALVFPQWVLLGLALILTFNRSYWFAIVLAVPLLLYVIRRNDRARFIRWFVGVASILGVVTLISLETPESQLSRLARAAIDRAETLISPETLREGSVEVRRAENAYALPQVAANPFLGIGLGAKYRPWDPRIDWRGENGPGFDGRGFIHNGHLWIMMKTGLLGYLALLWLSFTFVWRGFKHWSSINETESRGFVLGFSLAYLGIFITAVVNSTFMEWYWTPVIGMMMGMSEVALKQTDLCEAVGEILPPS